jgi:hypothetical protein
MMNLTPVGPVVGKHVEPAVEQCMSWTSINPSFVPSLPDGCSVEAIHGLSDLPQDTEKFFNGLPTEIAYSNECILELELKSLH